MSARARAEGPRLPTLAELRRATAETAATMADPKASVHDKYAAAEREASALHAFEHTPGNQAKADLELYLEAGI